FTGSGNSITVDITLDSYGTTMNGGAKLRRALTFFGLGIRSLGRTLASPALALFVIFAFFCVLVSNAAETLPWHQENGFKWAELSVPKTGRTGFARQQGASTRILFTNRLAESRSITNRILLSGSGVAAGDVDGDGLCDLYFCGLDGDNVLYRNLGNWKFEDITARAGVACPDLDSTGAVFADLDGDGDLDLLVTTLGN